MRTCVSWGRSFLLLLGLAVVAGPASAVTIDWVFVGDPGNAADTPSTNCWAANCGSVPHEYYIAKYEVTNSQYADFLNLKAAADPLTLYNPNMGSNAQGGITRSGSPGTYTYQVKAGFADKPVNFVSILDAMRFTNWLNNGQEGADTETGSYALLGTATPSGVVTKRNPAASIFIPRENEWYKAAYYDGLSATYFNTPGGANTMSCSMPTGTANRANCSDAVGGVTDVGAYTGSASPYGTFDQGGNVRELNEKIFSSGVAPRGGGWDGIGNLFGESPVGASVRGVRLTSTFESVNIGFRVAMVPEPGTALLLMTGLAGLAARQERRKRNL